MESSLHRQLKALYADADHSQTTQETPLGDYRIDVVRGRELVEIQHGSLAAIRSKVVRLLRKHDVRVVKPLIVRKTLVHWASPDGPETHRRASPKRGSILSLFEELIYFVRVFPHRRLTLDAPLVEIEEYRYPGHGRRRRWRKSDFQIADQTMVRVCGIETFRTGQDLLRLLPTDLPSPFHTGHLAKALNIPRWSAQQMTYCLRQMDSLRTVGKMGNAWMYEIGRSRRTAV